MSIFNFKTKREKEQAQLENICENLKDKYLTTGIVIRVTGEGGDPDQQFEGIIVLSRFPTEEKPTVAQG